MSPNKPFAIILILLGALALICAVSYLWVLLMVAWQIGQGLFFVLNIISGGFIGWHVMNAFRALR